MLSFELMSQVSARFKPPGELRVLLDDASVQASYCLDSPDTAEDGMEYFIFDEDPDVRGPVPRIIELRG